TQSPSGNVLSQNQSFPIDVVAGHANVPNITLAGIPNSIEVLPLTGDLSVLPSADFGGTRLEITPLKSASLLAVALDADGNAIFGPGSPAFTVTVGGGYTTSILGNNVLIRSPQTPAKGSWPITVGTTTCSGGGTCSTSNWTISAAPLVAVAQANPPSVSVYAGLGSKLGAAIASSSLSSPQAVAFDLHGNLFVANATGGAGGKGSISEYAPPYTQTAPTAVITSGISTPSALAVSRINGNLAVLNTGGGAPTVAVYAPGSTTPISTPFATSAGLSSIAFDSSDNLWYSTTLPSGNVKELLAAGKYASAGTDVVVGGTPSSIVLDGSGDLYVADSAAESVSEYSAPAYASPTAIIGSLTGSPRLTVNNNLPADFGHYDGATLLGIAASNTFAVYEPFETSFLMNYGDAAFQAQAYDQDANLWLGPNNPYPYSGFGYISWRSYGQELNTREAVGNGIAAFPAP
ncbi:MAG: hypothetical protein JOY98_04940, partial [Candidatus Eremiobacteraeota bacterium]|nr:hypothetical protein [Candidatus Eremiobacteraeota bacterium]